MSLRPFASSRPNALELKTNLTRGGGRARGPDTEPIGTNQIAKGLVREPVIVETEDRELRNSGGGLEQKGNMVGHGARQGGQGRVWQRGVPCGVNHEAVKADNDRRGLIIRPSEHAI